VAALATPDAILVFAPGAQGGALPVRTIDINDRGSGCAEVAVDGKGNIVCSINELGSIEVFTPDQTGNATPARLISAGHEIVRLSLDPEGNIYVATAIELNSDLPVSILEFAGGVGGSATPINTLESDALPNSTAVSSLSFDATGNLYVYEQGSATQ